MTPPRLAYIGDVPPRAISAGPAVLFRLFETYPADRLLVCEDASNTPDPTHQLPQVEHVRYALGRQHWLRTRLGQWYGSWMYLRSRAVVAELLQPLRAFGCGAIVGIGHGYAWWPAWLAAQALKVPFHLIVHDHWRSFLTIRPELNRHAQRRFRTVYRGAQARLLISPAMVQRYQLEYGAPGTLLYPSRRYGSEELLRPSDRATAERPFVFAYAGGVSGWTKLALIDLAHAVAPLGAEVRIHQHLRIEDLGALGLKTRNVQIVPFQPAESLERDLAANSDALFLPMSFAPEDRDNVALCFPSKLVDYTAAALPLLLRAPEHATAVKWAEANPGVGEIVTTSDLLSLQHAAQRLLDDPLRRQQMAAEAFRAGSRDFSHRAVFSTFLQAIGAE